jgi:uncharacterized membrane protein
MNTRRLFNLLAILILIALSVTNVYRAKTQSITCDEAYSYQLWISQPLSRMFADYDAGNHVLQTLLAKVFVAIFGLSEFTLRLPTLIAGFLYFTAIYCICRLVFGEAGLFLLSVCVLSLNPLLLDLLSAARGYALALALCIWALYYMLKGPPHSPYDLLRLAILLALSVSSNVTFLFVDSGLACLFMVALLASSRDKMVRVALQAATYFIIPGIVLTLILIGGTMRNAHRMAFYFGLPSLARSAASLVHVSLMHHHYYNRLDPLENFLSAWFIPAILLLAGFLWIAAVHKRAFLKQQPDRFLFFCAGALLFSIASSYGAYKTAGLLYPVTRTGLPWIVFFLLTCLGLATTRIIRWPVLLFLLGSVFWFACQLNVSEYSEWSYDAGTKRIVSVLQRQHQAEPDKNWQVSVSWMLLPSLNFYKSLDHLDWFQPFDIRNGTAGFTRFVLAEKDTQLVQTLHLSTSYVDPVSGEVLAARQ